MFQRRKGFTLIELLVVISIISLLSSVVFASLKSARVKARDAVRAQDMQTIYTMLSQYSLQFGGIPITYTYGGNDPSGWDYSSQPILAPTFLSFLVTSGIAQRVPLDPVNDMPGDSTAGTYAYKYYCYTGAPGPGLVLGYRKEATGAMVYYPRQYDSDWTCL